MLTKELVITIPGHPAPKGSLKCIGGRGGRHQLIEDNARSKPWRDVVALWVRRRWPSDQHAEKAQPLGAEITFTINRPAGHYGTGQNAGILKDRYADARPVGHNTGDVDKLLRLALDALQDTDVLPDDSAVCEVTSRKAYVQLAPRDDVLTYPGVVIRLYPL